MAPDVALDVLEREASAFAELLVESALEAPVAGCPGWSLLDLAHHLGGVHRWARHVVVDGPSQAPVDGVPDDPAAVAPWFREGAADLVETLRGISPDRPCWTLAPPSTVRFWLRRQAHETTIHCWDAATAVGIDVQLDDALALDGLDEVATVFLPRQVRLGRLAPTENGIELVAASGASTLLTSDPRGGATSPVATITGSAGPLLLLAWKRLPLSDPRFLVTGDADAAQRLLDGAITP